MKEGRVGQHPTEGQPQRSDLLQPLSLPRSQPGRAVLQLHQTMSSGATRYDRLAANYLAFVQLASIRLWLRLYESASQRRQSIRTAETGSVDARSPVLERVTTRYAMADQNNSLAQKSKIGPNHVVAVLFCYTAITGATGNKA